MKALLVLLLAGLVLSGSGCSEEPDRVVRSTTEDGVFELKIEAEKGWVRPGGSLPIRVQVESRSGPVDEELVEDIAFVASNGSVLPSRLTVIMSGPDSLGRGAEHRFVEWITFTASSRSGTDAQGEVYALFRDVSATLKIRIVPAAE